LEIISRPARKVVSFLVVILPSLHKQNIIGGYCYKNIMLTNYLFAAYINA
jgi:hypothetical protein